MMILNSTSEILRLLRFLSMAIGSQKVAPCHRLPRPRALRHLRQYFHYRINTLFLINPQPSRKTLFVVHPIMK